MTRIVVWVSLVLAVVVRAESLTCRGVLGNSGEQGATLVRFGEKPASGMGVIYDRLGSLWDRAGDGVLNRYAVDGRQLASYRMASSPGRMARDSAVMLGDTLLLKVGAALYTLPIEAPTGATAAPLGVEATRLSFSSRDGWAVAARQKDLFWVNASGQQRPVATFAAEVEDVEVGPDGGVFVQSKGKLYRVDTTEPSGERGPWPSPGERPQWLAGYWYGSAWHGTLRRFSAALQPAPGVVLGGGSGAFIGYVEGNHELDNGRGLAHLRRNLYAVSGLEGIMHLLEWVPADQRFRIVRRIGSVRVCRGLGLDSKGRVWWHCGVWEWNDGPDAPLKHSVPSPDPPGIFGAAMLSNDVMVAPAIRWGKKALYVGSLDGPVTSQDGIEAIPSDGVACALVTREKRTALLVVNKQGKGTALFIGADGKYQAAAGAVELLASVPMGDLTSLASDGADTLLAAADGQIIEFQHGRETRRWSSWGDDSTARFGSKIFLAANGGRLWVSDTDRHRVLCFDLSSRKLVACFGATDCSDNGLDALNAPQALAAAGRRAVVHDAGNQRLLKLELASPTPDTE